MSTKLKDSALARLKKEVTKALENDTRVVFAMVFGSRARGTARDDSDLDIAVGLDPGGADDLLIMRMELMGKLSHLATRIDVVLASTANPGIAYRIARDGVVVYSRDHKAVTRFIAEAYGRHDDWQRFMKPHRDAMISRIEEDSYGG